MLRRNINKLLDPAYAQELKARLEYMRTILVPTCYRWAVLCKRGGGKRVADDGGDRAFTSLIAGTHFAPMGLTLLAILARVHKVIRPKKEKEEEKEAAEEKMVVKVPEEVKVNGTGLVVGPVTMEDFGETIRREAKEGGEEEEKMAVPEKKEVSGRKVAEKRVAKKHKAVTQELTKTSKVPLRKPNQVHQGGTSSELIAKAEEKKERAMKKAKAMEMASSSQPPPSPPVTKELPKIKSKRKSEDKEGKKKKKRKKDEIDDLFAGLL